MLLRTLTSKFNIPSKQEGIKASREQCTLPSKFNIPSKPQNSGLLVYPFIC